MRVCGQHDFRPMIALHTYLTRSFLESKQRLTIVWPSEITARREESDIVKNNHTIAKQDNFNFMRQNVQTTKR